MERCGAGTRHAGLGSVQSLFMVSIPPQSSGRGAYEVRIIPLQINELVTLVKLSFVSRKLRNGNFLGEGKLSCLQGCEPTPSSCRSTRQSACG